MAQIDAAPRSASFSATTLAKVKQLRATGEAQHKAAQHAASVTTLAQAKALLGL